MKKINFGARPIDLQRIVDILKRCPDIDNPTQALREGLKVLDEQTKLSECARKVQKREAQK